MIPWSFSFNKPFPWVKRFRHRNDLDQYKFTAITYFIFTYIRYFKELLINWFGLQSDRDIFYLVVHSSNGHTSQVWVRPKPGASNSNLVSLKGSGAQVLTAFPGTLARGWIRSGVARTHHGMLASPAFHIYILCHNFSVYFYNSWFDIRSKLVRLYGLIFKRRQT